MFISKYEILRGLKPVKKVDIEQHQLADQGSEELGKRELETPEETDCELEKRKKIFSSQVEKIETISGVFMREDMYDFICHCDNCLDKYLEADPLLGLLTDKFYEDTNFQEAVAQAEEVPLDQIEGRVDSPDQEFMKYMAGKFRERTGRDINHHETLVMSEHYSKLKEVLGNMILTCGKTEITEQDMRDLLKKLKLPDKAE